MTVRDILAIGQPGLRIVADEVPGDQIASDRVQRLIDDLIETMRDADGAGLAATQIGEPVRIAVDAPTHHHLAHRPGVPLVRRTIGPLAATSHDLQPPDAEAPRDGDVPER